nr:uncharacterized protein LOC127328612 [Lolium perenne]
MREVPGAVTVSRGKGVRAGMAGALRTAGHGSLPHATRGRPLLLPVGVACRAGVPRLRLRHAGRAALRTELVQRARPPARDQDREASWRADRGRSPPRREQRRDDPLPLPAGPPAARKKKKSKKRRAVGGGAVGGSQLGHLPMVPPQGLPLDGRSDTQLGVSATPEKSPTANICFNCGVRGHFRSECPRPEQCLFCGDPGHQAAACTERFNSHRRREVIEYLGHGIDGGFYYIDLGGAELRSPQHLAVITVEVTVDTIRTELTQLESTWVWNVREISPTEFAVAFPSAELLRALSWGSSTILPANNINVSVLPSCVDPDTVATLSEVWVRVHGIPEEARTDHILELISQIIGKLVTVDPLSLPGAGPVRMLILCPDPTKLACTLPHVFFGKGGRALTVEVEGDEAQAGAQTPPLDPSQSHHDDDADDDDVSSDGGSEDDLGGDGKDYSQRQAPGTGAESSAALDVRPGAQSAQLGLARTLTSAPAKLGAAAPRAPPAVAVGSCGLSILEYGFNFPQDSSSASVGLDVCPPQSPRSPGLVCYTRSTGSTPTSPQGPATPGPTVLEPASVFPDTPVAGAKARAQRRQRQSTLPSRHSASLARSRSGAEVVEPTVAEQAERRAAARNLDSGTRSTPRPPSFAPPPPNSGSRFSVLATASLDHLGQVASDCGVVFRGERGPRAEQLAAIQAKEVYDGVLAASRAQLERERATSATSTDPVQLASGSGLEPSNGGFEAPGRKQQLKEYIRRENVDIVGLQETIKESFLLHELEGLSRHKFAWHWRPASGHSGGILLGVREDTFEVEDMEHGEFFVSMAVTHRRSNLSWEVIIVYGPADHSRSQAFLVELRAKIDRCTTPVVVAGDFNLIRSPEDKSSRRVDIPRMRMFNDCLADLALREITRVGARFTWCNNRIDPVQSVLDRPGFVEAVGYKWERAAESPPRVFNAVDVWHHCTKIARQFMRGWGANLRAEVRLKKDLLLRQIQELDCAADEEGLAAEEWLQRFALEHSLMEIFRGEEEAGEITTHIYSFYKGLFAVGPRTGVALAADLWPARAWVSDEENAALTLPFLPTEVRGALEGMKTSSAPGPDGLPVVFFQKFWAKLQETIMPMFQEFYVGTLDMGRLNYGVITLIPKVVGATDIRQFRPITVINVIQRLFSKVCAVRLAPVMEQITHQYQFAFLKGRHIHDGILALHEIVHEVRSRHQRGVFLKLDFQKAYDRLDWSFLRQVLQRRGVDDRMIGWIMQTVMTGSTAININGEVGPYFRPACGVRQGDPLSPILFNAAVDSLVEILERARISGHITGVVSHLIPGGGVTHLQYADDTMIMFEGSDRDIQNTKFLLLCFEAMSGLKINFDKSEVVVLGYPPEAQQRIADNLNCRLAIFPVSYLGVPVRDSRILIRDLAPLVGRVRAKAKPWRGRFTSKGSKTVLIDSCLSSLPMYIMGLYLLPEGVHAAFDKELSRFFWQDRTGRQKYHMVKWADVCAPKDLGGIGIISSRHMNVALILKWVWRILSDDGGLWLKLIKAKYLRGRPLLACDRREGSQFWRALQDVKHEVRAGLSFSIGDGRGTMFWLDPWLGASPICLDFPDLFAICANPPCLVADVAQRGWDILFRRGLTQGEALSLARLRNLLPDALPGGLDSPSWRLSPSGSFSQWYPLCRQRDRERLDGMLEDLLAAVRRLFTSSSL